MEDNTSQLLLLWYLIGQCKRTQHCWPTTPNIIGCYMLHSFAHPVACCWMLLCVVAQSLKPVNFYQPTTPSHSSSNIVGATHAHYAWFTKTYGLYPSHDALQVPTLLGVVAPFAQHCQHARNNSQHYWRNNVESCCVRLRTIVTHGLQRLGLYPSHDTPMVPILFGVVASVCTPLPTRTQQLPPLLRPTLLAQQCWELLRPFARSL